MSGCVNCITSLLDLQARGKNLSEQIEWIKSESSQGLASREELESELKELETRRQQLLPKRLELASERKQLETHRQKLESARQELESGRRWLDSERKELATTREKAQFEIECLQKGEMIPSRYNWKSLPDALYVALQRLQEHGDVADLILPSDETDCRVLGVSDEARQANVAGDDYDNVMRMPLRDKMLYFLKRPEVSRELHVGDARACVIPLQLPKECKEQENLLLIRVKNSLKAGSEVAKALKEDQELLVNFSSFEYAANPNPKDRSVSGLVHQIRNLYIERKEYEAEREEYETKEYETILKEYDAKRKRLELLLDGGEMIPTSSSFSEVSKNHSLESSALEVVFRTVEEHGDISDLIVSSEDPDWHILGVFFVNVHGRMARTKYAGPRDYGDRFPKYIKAPDGTLLYELTEEMVRKEMEKVRVRWEPRTAYAGPRFEKPTSGTRPVSIIIDDDDF